jgi:MFS family permease
MRALVITTLCLAATSVSDAWLFVLAQKKHALPPALFPLLYVAMNAAYFFFAIPSGIVADRVGKANVFSAGHLALAAAYLLVGFGGLTSVLMWSLPVLLGLFYACTDGVLPALAAGSLDEKSRAGGLALLGFTGGIGRLAASTVFALLVSLAGNRAATGAFVFLLVLAIGVATVLLRPRHMRHA